MSTANTVTTAAVFNKSIEAALKRPPALKESIDRILRDVSKLPDEKLYISNRRQDVIFYTLVDDHQKYQSKKTDEIWHLARRKYLLQLVEILKLTDTASHRGIQKRQALIRDLQKMVASFERGNLDIFRITLTDNQYRWLTSHFEQKRINPAKALQTVSGLYVRSKSERDILNAYEDWAVPYHYEERQFIFVKPLVDKLEEELQEMGFRSGQLYTFGSYDARWNVPPELEVINARGSIWRSYYPPKGTIKIFNDIKTMFADGSFFIHEHEGMMNMFGYRLSASERASVMKFTGTVDNAHFLETYEHDIDTREKVSNIIKSNILPRLWF
ncbi:MAG: hypothetical protein IJH05_08845 [Firmicutes bacterium]|nr:hypothetical protein [Bacillota bacterium]